MSAGLADRFTILEQSPLDSCSSGAPCDATAPHSWVASRFNVQTTNSEGELIVWNTFRGTMSTFPAAQRERIRGLLRRKPFDAEPTGLVGYLQDRGFLVPAEADEYRRFQLKFGERHYRSDILELTLLSSEDCNFRCTYCYEKFARGTMEPWVRAAVKKLVEQRLPGLRRLTVSWFGGEPLYGFEAIRDLAPHFAEVTAEHEIPYSSAITTNGYLLTPERADQLLAWGVKDIQVTIDGLPDDHDRLRPTRTGEPTFQRIFENLKGFVGRPEDFRLVVRINFDPRSHEKVKSFLALLSATFESDPRIRILLRPVGKWGGENDRDLNVCGYDEGREITDGLATALEERGFESFDDLRTMGRFGANVCYAARPAHFIVGASGKLMKCTVALDTDEKNIVGRLTPEGELDLNPDRVSLWAEPVFTAVEKCRSCVVLPLCHGMACPYQRIRGADAHCPPVKKELQKNLLRTNRSAEGKAKTLRIPLASREELPRGATAVPAEVGH